MRAVLVLAAATAVSAAMDSASFRYLGASPGGTHAAWMSYGVQDGSGFPWADLEILATSPYRVVERYSVLISDEGASADKAPDSVLSLASAGLRRLRITAENGGQVLVDHKLTDAGVPPDTVVFSVEPYYTWYPGVTYTMVLEQVPAMTTERAADWFPDPVLVKLIMYDGRSRALVFRELEAPEEYRLSFAYRIAKVLRPHEGALLVVFNVMQPGFEGPDLRYRLISVEFPIAWRN